MSHDVVQLAVSNQQPVDPVLVRENTPEEEDYAPTTIGKFGKRDIREHRCVAIDFWRLNFDRPLANRSVRVKRAISASVCIACDVSKLKWTVKKGLMRLIDSGNFSGMNAFEKFEKSLHATFRPVFMQHGESAEDGRRIREFLAIFLPKMFDERRVLLIYDLCIDIFMHSGAMALFGIFKNSIDEIKQAVKPLTTAANSTNELQSISELSGIPARSKISVNRASFHR
jgi:hypothetical protein